MENNRLKFGYEEVYKKIEVEIFGLIFEINKKKIENQDINNVNEKDEDVVKRKIEEIIGEGAIEKLNNKAISDGYSSMTLAEESKVLTFLYTTYMKFTTNEMIKDVTNTSKEIEEKAKIMSNINYKNREQKRNYNRNQYRGRKNYRRY